MSTLDVPEEQRLYCCCDSVHLTEREVRVLGLLASGKTSSEIAAALRLSRRTVDGRVAVMLRKAAVRNRGELLAMAVAHGIIDLLAGTPRWTGRSCLPVPPQPIPLQPGPVEPPL
jgi:DNA-binding CsgD family transcriptional regulator